MMTTQESTERVNFRLIPRGGYGWPMELPAVVLHRGEQVRIAVYNKYTKRVEHRKVRPEKLSPRTVASLPLDELVSQETMRT